MWLYSHFTKLYKSHSFFASSFRLLSVNYYPQYNATSVLKQDVAFIWKLYEIQTYCELFLVSIMKLSRTKYDKISSGNKTMLLLQELSKISIKIQFFQVFGTGDEQAKVFKILAVVHNTNSSHKLNKSFLYTRGEPFPHHIIIKLCNRNCHSSSNDL